MAGEWIKMRTDLAEDPAVIGIADELDMDEDAVVGKLHRLWSWADRQLSDGNARSVTEKWVDRYVNAPGFARAMAKQGWLVIDSAGVTFPNFERHMSQTAKKRALTRERVRASRSASVTPTGADCNAPGVTSSPSHSYSSSPKKKKKGTRFTPPSLEEVQAYCESAGFPIDVKHFIDHYTETGWRKKGGSEIRDWKAAVRNWHRNDEKYKASQSRAGPAIGRRTAVNANAARLFLDMQVPVGDE